MRENLFQDMVKQKKRISFNIYRNSEQVIFTPDSLNKMYKTVMSVMPHNSHPQNTTKVARIKQNND